MINKDSALRVWLVDSALMPWDSLDPTDLADSPIQGFGIVRLIKILTDFYGQEIEFTHVPHRADLFDRLGRHLIPDLIIMEMFMSANQKNYRAGRGDINGGFFFWHRLRIQKGWGEAAAAVPILVATQHGCLETRPAMEATDRQLLRWAGHFTADELIGRLKKLLPPVKAKAKAKAKAIDGQPVSGQLNQGGSFTITVSPGEDIGKVYRSIRQHFYPEVLERAWLPQAGKERSKK